MTAKPKPVPSFDWNKLDQEIAQRKAQQAIQSRQAYGGFTVSEYAKQYGLTKSTARRRVQRLLREGVVKVIGRVPAFDSIGRSVVRIAVYDLVTGKEMPRGGAGQRSQDR